MTACSAGDEGSGTFTSFGSAPGGSSPASADDGDESEGDTEGSSDGDDGDGGSVSSDDAAEAGDATTTGPDPTTGAPGTTDDGGMDSAAGSSDDGGVPGAQPNSGMWAHCVMDDFSNCGAADTCIYLDANGFCSVQGCTNAAVDCDPAPVGTSVTPICADAVSTAVCALDCSTAACPTGMVCTTFSINMGPEYDICV